MFGCFFRGILYTPSDIFIDLSLTTTDEIGKITKKFVKNREDI
jgi:hypothetical protein